MTKPTAQVIWCDDIRQEVGNKPSLMGVYLDGMNVPMLPYLLQKISAWLIITTPSGRPIKRWSVQLVLNEDVVLMDMPESDVPPPAEDGKSRELQTLAMAITAGTVELPAECQQLKLRVTADGKALDSMALKIMVAG